MIGMAIVFVGLPVPRTLADAQQKTEELIDEPQRGSEVGPQRGNWVAVPIPVSNPTIGTGLQAVVMYLHPNRRGEDGAPNATTGVGAMYTNTGSWFAGGFHNNSWDNGRYRFAFYGGAGELQLRFYGIGDVALPGNRSVQYALGLSVVGGKLLARLPGTDHWYAGPSYVYFRSESVFDLSNVVPQLPPTEINIPYRSASLGLLVNYDSRDDNYYPTRGQYFQAGWHDFSENWGGDQEFQKSTVFYNYYHLFGKQTVLALRARAEDSSEGTPFFFLSSLVMRGFSRDRYLATDTLSIHSELRHKFLERWGAVVFVESGWYGDTFSKLADSRTIISYGTGLRWQATKDKSLHLALDFAVSTDDRAVYFRIGEAY